MFRAAIKPGREANLLKDVIVFVRIRPRKEHCALRNLRGICVQDFHLGHLRYLALWTPAAGGSAQFRTGLRL